MKTKEQLLKEIEYFKKELKLLNSNKELSNSARGARIKDFSTKLRYNISNLEKGYYSIT